MTAPRIFADCVIIQCDRAYVKYHDLFCCDCKYKHDIFRERLTATNVDTIAIMITTVPTLNVIYVSAISKEII